MSVRSEVAVHMYDDEEVRTLLIDGQVHFIAADLCEVLGLGRVHDAVRGLDEDERGTDTIRTPGGPQKVTTVTEAGMYSMVLRSRKPEARAFKRWVTHEVLPEIRQTGQYTRPQSLEERALALMGELQARVDDQARELEQARPKVAQIDMYREAEGLQTISDLANQLQIWAAANAPDVKVLHQDVFDLAGELHMIIRGDTVRKNQPTALGVKSGWVRVKETIIHKPQGDEVKISCRLTHRGAGRLWDAAVARLQVGERLVTRKAS